MRCLNGTESEVLARVIMKAWVDEGFKTQLLTNPKSVLENEGLCFADDTEVKVVADSESMRHFVLPSSPHELNLSEEELLLMVHDRLSSHLELF